MRPEHRAELVEVLVEGESFDRLMYGITVYFCVTQPTKNQITHSSVILPYDWLGMLNATYQSVEAG